MGAGACASKLSSGSILPFVEITLAMGPRVTSATLIGVAGRLMLMKAANTITATMIAPTISPKRLPFFEISPFAIRSKYKSWSNLPPARASVGHL